MPPVVDLTERRAARVAAPPRGWAAALDLDGEPEGARVHTLIQDLARELSAHVEPIGAAIARRLPLAEPRLVDPDDPTVAAPRHAARAADVGAVLAGLANGVPTDAARPTQPSIALFEHLAERDDGLAVLLRSHRAVNAELWQVWAAFSDERVRDRRLHRAVLALSTRQLAAYADSVCEHLTADVAGRAAPAAARVGRAGRAARAPGRVRERARRRGGAGRAPLPARRVPRRRGAPAVRRRRPARRPRAEAEADLRRAGAGRAGRGRDDGLDRVRARRRGGGARARARAARPRACRSGSATWAPGSTASAARASRPRTRCGSRRSSEATGITRYRDVALLAVLCADEARAQELARVELGPLAGDDEVAIRLRETVRVYLAAGESQVATAQRLFIHEKTVKYRLTPGRGAARPQDRRAPVRAGRGADGSPRLRGGPLAN